MCMSWSTTRTLRRLKLDQMSCFYKSLPELLHHHYAASPMMVMASSSSSSEPSTNEETNIFDESCCGDEIRTRVLGRHKAWVTCGIALEHFEKKIMPHVGTIMRNVDRGDADLYMRIYMVGKTKESATPIVAVICSDVSVAKNAKKALKTSTLMIKDHPSFSIGWFARPLGHPTPVHLLSSQTIPITSDTHCFDSHDRPALLSTTAAPVVGRPLVLESTTSRYATGGVILYRDEKDEYYQLTVGHLFNREHSNKQSEATTPDDEDDNCSFDGQSESDDEVVGAPEDTDGLSFASRSFCGDEDGLLDKDSIFSAPEPPAEETSQAWAMTLQPHKPANSKGFQADSRELVEVGSLAFRSQDDDRSRLDYALVVIKHLTSTEKRSANLIKIPGLGATTKTLDIRQIGRPKPGTETRIYAVTSSGDVTSGFITPGNMYLLGPEESDFRPLLSVCLDGPLAYGDSGSVIVDETSGELYGHITSGCIAANTAYVVPAREIFADIQRVLKGRVHIRLAEDRHDAVQGLQLCAKKDGSRQSTPNMSAAILEHAATKLYDKPSVTENPRWTYMKILILFAISFLIYFPFVLLVYNTIQSSVSTDWNPWYAASTTNIVVSLLSELSTLSIWVSLNSIREAWRMVLVRRGRGTSLPSWLISSQDPSLHTGKPLPLKEILTLSSFVSVLYTILPLCGFLSGSLLKLPGDYEDYFLPSTPPIMVYGKAPLVQPTHSNASVYFPRIQVEQPSHLPRFLYHPRFMVEWNLDSCGSNCTAYLLPVQLGYQDHLHSTLWSYMNTSFNSNLTRMRNAPGHILEFRTLDTLSSYFDPDMDCFHPGAVGSIPLVICVKQSGTSITAGLFRLRAALGSSRKQIPRLDVTSRISITEITMYSLTTTTIYDTKKGQILESWPTSPLSLVPIDAPNYKAIFESAFISPLIREENEYEPDVRQADARRGFGFSPLSWFGDVEIQQELYTLSWTFFTLLRLDTHSEGRLLRSETEKLLPNLLAVPVQFTLVSLVYANYSTDFIASAEGGTSSLRYVILPWAGWVYIFLITTIHAFVAYLSISFLWVERGGLRDLVPNFPLRFKKDYSVSMRCGAASKALKDEGRDDNVEGESS
ncbi:hypothetical protein V8F33_005483 [Rhypophila sp. PSN 637]